MSHSDVPFFARRTMGTNSSKKSLKCHGKKRVNPAEISKLTLEQAKKLGRTLNKCVRQVQRWKAAVLGPKMPQAEKIRLLRETWGKMRISYEKDENDWEKPTVEACVDKVRDEFGPLIPYSTARRYLKGDRIVAKERPSRSNDSAFGMTCLHWSTKP